MSKEIAIIGGGIAGLTTAIALNKIGLEPVIFEAAPEIKAVGAGLGLGANAIIAFERLGIKKDVVNAGRNLTSFSIYDRRKKLITKTDFTKLNSMYGIGNFTIHRAELHNLLLSKINPDLVRADKKAIDFEQTQNSIQIKFSDGSTHKTDFIIAADGIHSIFRKKLLPGSEPRYAGYTCWRAVVDNADLNLEETSETWDTNGRFGIVPLGGNKVYWFACLTGGQNDREFRHYTIDNILQHFINFHDPITKILEATKNENLLWNDIIDLEPINKFAFGNILLIGDAAHATTPNMGQGACQAVEDAVVIADEIRMKDDIKNAFAGFERRRMPRTHGITETSWKIGRLAQTDKFILAAIRNFIFRATPRSVNEKQLAKLYNVDF